MVTDFPEGSRRRKTIAGRYRLISQLGEGGMGIAYRAWDIQNGIPVVIKMPKKELLYRPQIAKRFAREVSTMAEVPHPHIVKIVDSGEDAGGDFAGVPFVAMRFLPGGSLSQRRLRDAAGRPLQNHPATLHLWLPDIASALDAVHAAGIVHRDVKPANIFFDGFWNSFLGDFGIAKQLQDTDMVGEAAEPLTGTNIGVGTQEYMSPEQFSPKAVIDGRADQYALAVMVYELIAGSLPFIGKTALAVEHLTLPPPPLADRYPGLPPRLCNAVHWALAKNPEDRFASCSEFAETVLADVMPMTPEHDVVRLLCPGCSNILKLPLTAGGRKGKCPLCQTAMNVAKDLGSLWLIGEEKENEQDSQSKPDSGAMKTLTRVPTTVAPTNPPRKWPKVDPYVFIVGLVAWGSFLFISHLLSEHFKDTSHLSQQLQELREDNERLTDELTKAKDAIAQANAARLLLEQRSVEEVQTPAADTPDP